MAAAWSEHRKRITAANWAGVTQRLGSASGMLARLAGVSMVLANTTFA
jgi:hypothetical protein